MHVFFIGPIPRRSQLWRIDLLSLDFSGIFESAVPVFESGMAPGFLIKLPVHNEGLTIFIWGGNAQILRLAEDELLGLFEEIAVPGAVDTNRVSECMISIRPNSVQWIFPVKVAFSVSHLPN